jgi:DNA-binding FrmR family transcriptional regulator
MKNQTSLRAIESKRIAPTIIPEIKDRALFRLRSVAGHLDGVIKMLEREDYCIDIIKQITAIEVALGKVNTLLLENHLDTCVTTAIEEKDPSIRRRVVKELLEIYRTER